jgi:hypothetical protein
MPSGLRKAMGLKPGAILRWERVSGRECRVVLEGGGQPDPLKALGYGPKLRGDRGRRTSEWMRELRAGE